MNLKLQLFYSVIQVFRCSFYSRRWDIYERLTDVSGQGRGLFYMNILLLKRPFYSILLHKNEIFPSLPLQIFSLSTFFHHIEARPLCRLAYSLSSLSPSPLFFSLPAAHLSRTWLQPWSLTMERALLSSALNAARHLRGISERAKCRTYH